MRIWHRVLMVTAAIVAMTVVSIIFRKTAFVRVMGDYMQGLGIGSASVNLPYQPADTAEAFYPYRWQTTQREQLRALLAKVEKPPTGTDALSQARYAQYALLHGDEAVFREGVRRDPHNALYHYLLADDYVKHSLTGGPPETDKATGRYLYRYQITDRHKLDLGMHELAIGMRLPYQSHRATLLRAQLDAMPPIHSFQEQIQVISVLAAVLFPEYARLRNLARVNGFYLNVLLAEGKRAEVAPFLHTGERLPVQISNDNPPTLIGQLVALAIGAIGEKSAVQACRDHGLIREAAMIEAHHQVLMGKVAAWKNSLQHRKPNNPGDRMYQEHAGILAAILLPVMGTGQSGWVTADTLAPSRLVEYLIVEETAINGLVMLFFLFMLYAGMKAWRGTVLLRGEQQAAPLSLTRVDWLQIIGIGFLLPLALYLLYINIPALSGRDHGIIVAAPQCFAGILIVSLWILLVPTMLAAGKLWRYGKAAGLITVERPWKTRFSRLGSTLGSLLWIGLAVVFVLVPVGWLVLSTFIVWVHGAQVVTGLTFAFAMLALPLLPIAWLRRRTETAAFHLALARGMVPVYAIFTLLLGALLPVATTCERYYIQHDRVLGLMTNDDIISFTQIEGKVCLMLRGYINDGARQLRISWEKPSNN